MSSLKDCYCYSNGGLTEGLKVYSWPSLIKAYRASYPTIVLYIPKSRPVGSFGWNRPGAAGGAGLLSLHSSAGKFRTSAIYLGTQKTRWLLRNLV